MHALLVEKTRARATRGRELEHRRSLQREMPGASPEGEHSPQTASLAPSGLADSVPPAPPNHRGPVPHAGPAVRRLQEAWLSNETSEDLGALLDPSTATEMSSRFAYDFSDIRIHTNSLADRAAGELSAKAFAFGKNIAFAGSVDPASRSGKALLAHELAHVIQQRNGKAHASYPASSPRSDAAELEASVAASLVASGRATTIRKSSDVRIACASTEDEFEDAIDDFRKKTKAGFLERHGIGAPTSLNDEEIGAVINAVKESAGNTTLEVAVSFFKYYSSHKLEKADADAEAAMKKTDQYAATSPESGTQIRSDVLSFPPSRLGPLLLHEFGHTHDIQNVMGAADFEEGHAYAVEYFFAKKTGASERLAQILKIVSSGGVAVQSQRAALQQLFGETLAMLNALQEIINRGSSQRVPSDICSNATEAADLLAYLTANSHDLPPKLEKLRAVVKGHLDNFGVPSLAPY
jgi:hypothetical protein